MEDVRPDPFVREPHVLVYHIHCYLCMIYTVSILSTFFWAERDGAKEKAGAASSEWAIGDRATVEWGRDTAAAHP